MTRKEIYDNCIKYPPDSDQSFRLFTCPVCLKKFCVSTAMTLYKYKRSIYSTSKKFKNAVFCSYSCMRSIDELFGKDSRKYQDKTVEDKDDF